MFTFKAQNKFDEQPSFGSSLKPGFYNAQIVKVDAETSQAGNPQLKLTVEITNGNTFIQITEWLTLTQRAAWKIERWLAACGYQFAAGEQIDINQNTFLGRRCVVLTYMTPGKETNADGSEKLFVSILRAVRPEDAPCLGPLELDEYPTYGLAADGTDAHRARAKAPAQQSGWGAKPAPQPARQQNGWSRGRNTNYDYPEEDDLGF